MLRWLHGCFNRDALWESLRRGISINITQCCYGDQLERSPQHTETVKRGTEELKKTEHF